MTWRCALRTVTFDEAEWQVVPKKPTFLMIEAGDEHGDAEKVYEAMLIFSPEPLGASHEKSSRLQNEL